MSNVTLTIGGREYVVACADGEESHIVQLGRLIDAKLASMGNTGGQSESRTLLFAALLLADELHELRTAAAAAPPAPPVDAPVVDTGAADAARERLARIAQRLENIASHLES